MMKKLILGTAFALSFAGTAFASSLPCEGSIDQVWSKANGYVVKFKAGEEILYHEKMKIYHDDSFFGDIVAITTADGSDMPPKVLAVPANDRTVDPYCKGFGVIRYNLDLLNGGYGLVKGNANNNQIIVWNSNDTPPIGEHVSFYDAQGVLLGVGQVANKKGTQLEISNTVSFFQTEDDDNNFHRNVVVKVNEARRGM